MATREEADVSDETSESSEGSFSDEYIDEYIKDQDDIPITGIRAYDFEPAGSPLPSSSDDELEYGPLPNSSDVGSLEWCVCGNCRVMTTNEENVCCQEAVPEHFLDGKMCVTLNENFGAFLQKVILVGINEMSGSTYPDNNKSLRYAGYRSYTWWVHSKLERRVRRIIPSCVVWAIRNLYPDPNNDYVSFKH